MPRKKQVNEDIETEVKVVDIDPQDMKVKRMLQSMPGGLKCLQVFRYHPGSKGGRPEYIDDISPDQFDFKMLKSMFGGGKFQVKWENENGTESKGDFEIAGPRIDFDYVPEPPADQPTAPLVAPSQTTVLPQPQGIDPMMMLKMIQEARKEAREEMRTMLEFMRPQQQSPDVTKQVFEIVEKIAPMMSGGDGGGNPWMMALAQFKDPILKIVDSVHLALTKPPATMQPNPPSMQATMQDATQSQPQQPSKDDMLKLLIRQYLPVFVNAARNNGAHDIYADMILDQVPQTMYPKIATWLQGPDWFADIVAMEKNVEFQAGWWNLLRASILQGIEEHATSDIQPAADSERSED